MPLVLTTKSIQIGETIGGVESIEILLDRRSLEAFVNDGEISSTNFALPTGGGLLATAAGDPAVVRSITVNPLKSIWQER